MKIAVYELRDGRAYSDFIKTTTGDISIERDGVHATHIITSLKKITGEYRTDNIPCNTDTLDDETIKRIISERILYMGTEYPLYQLNSKAYALAEKMGMTA